MEFNFKNDEEILQAVAYTAGFLNSLFPLDCLAAVSDGEKFLMVYPGEEFDPGIKSGDPVSADGVVPEVMRTGAIKSKELSEEAYGIPLKTTTVPIKNGRGKVIGTLDIAFDLSTQNQLMKIAEQVAAAAQQVSGSCQEVSGTMEMMKKSQAGLQESSVQAQEYLEKTDEILALIEKVASQTNLLGINASIEAARSGEKGRGFAVVASGIQDLADKTSASAGEVSEIMKEIENHYREIGEQVTANEKMAGEIHQALQEIAENMQENSEVAENLLAIARIL